MSIKYRLIIMNFLQFFVWGSWLISLGGYMGGVLHFEGGQIGAIFATMGIASLIMPGLTGIIADKWVNAERLYGILHLLGAACLFYASTATCIGQCYSTCWYICQPCHWPTPFHTMLLNNINVISSKISLPFVYGELSVSFAPCGR